MKKNNERKDIGNHVHNHDHVLGFIASDHRGFALKEFLKSKFAFVDLGTTDTVKVDYPDYAKKLCKYVLKEKSMGVLICSTGIGMSIAANRHKGIRAALCHNEGCAEIARFHNDANVLVLSGDFTSPKEAQKIVEAFFEGKFSGEERHKRRIKKLDK